MTTKYNSKDGVKSIGLLRLYTIFVLCFLRNCSSYFSTVLKSVVW